jgi:multisubunit Na+/H+ antiporter MnhB subunit
MIERVRARKAEHKRRSKLYRIAVGILGTLLILAGLALSLPGVPGPGLLVAAVGLGMLALEFDRAERLLERLLDYLERVSDQASGASRTQKVLVVGLVALGVAGLVGAVLLWDVPFLPG